MIRRLALISLSATTAVAASAMLLAAPSSAAPQVAQRDASQASVRAIPAAPGGHDQVVTVRVVEFDEEETFLLGLREEAAHASVEVYSPTSPLGQAVLGKLKGDVANYTLANGKTVTVEIVTVTTYDG